MAAMRVGLLTGGGDSPGLNAVIRAIVRQGSNHHHDELFGFLNAWEGVMAQRYVDLTVESTRGLLPKGGTILGTRRGSPFDQPDGLEKVKQAFTDLVLDGIIAIGGNGTLTVSQMLFEQIGVPIVGVPKTIDNDIVGTDVTFGFHTAVQIATDAIDRLHTTAESHDRVILVEVMGRHAGWIATYSGIAGGATVILVPEEPFDLDAVCKTIRRRHTRGRYASIIVVAEGAVPVAGTMDLTERPTDEHGHMKLGGIAFDIAGEIELRTGFETGSSCSGTCSGAVPPTPTTGCCPPGTGWPPSTPSTTSSGVRWSSTRTIAWRWRHCRRPSGRRAPSTRPCTAPQRCSSDDGVLRMTVLFG